MRVRKIQIVTPDEFEKLCCQWLVTCLPSFGGVWETPDLLFVEAGFMGDIALVLSTTPIILEY